MIAANNAPESVPLLLEHGADVQARDENGTDALYVAVLKGDARLVAALLKKGADPSRPSHNGMTAAQVAEAAGHTDLASILKGELPT